MKLFTYIAGLLFLFALSQKTLAQEIGYDSGRGLAIDKFVTETGKIIDFPPVPVFSFMLNGAEISSREAKISMMPEHTLLVFEQGIMARFRSTGPLTATLEFINKGSDTLILENIIPFGTSPENVYITSTGPWSLTRAKLFRPGHGPVGVILPDNAWELGYGSFMTDSSSWLCGLARRTKVEDAQKKRYETAIFPGGMVTYTIHYETFTGPWQNGLKKVFREKYLYDLEAFDNTLFEREDLQWVRHAYVAGLNFAWDKDYYDHDPGRYTVSDYLEAGNEIFGGYDIYALWPTWPRLGLDERNQWDHFRDLPGGLAALRALSEAMHDDGTRLFICFNPWDESTRKEDPYKGIAAIIEATDADGVVLDCSGKSNVRLQEVADSIKPGVIMYSEGMAVVKDMPGIVSGRVHNAIYLSPPLNLNKLIKPGFAIFRVLDNSDRHLKRELAISFFNGYGNELNTMGPGRDEEVKDDLRFLGKTTLIMRQNSHAFLSGDWTPLIPSLHDSVWVNEWPYENKTLHTVLSFDPAGHNEPLFEIDVKEGYHYVSLWHHEEIDPVEIDNRHFLPATTDAFNPWFRNTRREGNVDCIASFPQLLTLDDASHRLRISAAAGDRIVVWLDEACYGFENKEFPAGESPVVPGGSWLAGNEKVIVQLFERDELIDERVYLAYNGKPWLISECRRTSGNIDRKGTLRIKGGSFSFMAENNDQFIPYPGPATPVDTLVHEFHIDRHPVTNEQYRAFLDATGYRPEVTDNFLKHWMNGSFPDSIAGDPVVYIDYRDAQAYAEWAGKRLPTELEWQYAMSTSELDYGQVWELTNDRYDNGAHTYVIMKGGSDFKPGSSWWYIQGGKHPPERQQMLLQVSPGFDRASTVGFRCVQDHP